MKLKFYIFTCLIIFFSFQNANGQSTCSYHLEMFDTFGDGWNGATIDFTINGVTTTHSVGINDNNGNFNTDEIIISDNSFYSLSYAGGSFENENSYSLVNPEGIVIFSDGPSPNQGQSVFEGIGDCPTCPTLNSESVIMTPTIGGFDLDWEAGQVAGTYIVEYGSLGFELGTGISQTTSITSINISGLEENIALEFYITLDCGGGDISNPIGPYFAQTASSNPPTECFYSLEMTSLGGNGWNGSFVEMIVDGVLTTHTVGNSENGGLFDFDDILVHENALVTLNQVGNVFGNYTLKNAVGETIFTSSTNPNSGNAIYQGIASCPACPLPLLSSIEVVPTGENTATLSWNDVTNADLYIVEYGIGCIELGQGTIVETENDSINIEGLVPNTLYTYYIQSNCDTVGLSNLAGPLFFQVAPFCNPPFNPVVLGVDESSVTILWVSDPDTEEYIVEYGPSGFALGGGFAIDPFAGNFIVIEGLSPNTDYDFYIYGSCANAQSQAIGSYQFSTTPSCPSISDFVIDTINSTTASTFWAEVSGAESYEIEFGQQGFELGTGQIRTTTEPNFIFTDLNPDVHYDVYISVICDDEFGISAGAFSMKTQLMPSEIGTNGSNCFYELQMFDSFGDGWNGAFLTMMNGSLNEDFTIDINQNSGDFNVVVEFEVTSGVPLVINYTPGTFENENTYVLTDSEGFVLLEDGPNPLIGEVFNNIAVCPLCSTIPNGELFLVTSTEALIAWEISSNANSYIVEYGSVGFELGTGNSVTTIESEFTISNLTPNTWYNAYITPDCGTEDGLGRSFGPIAFKTKPANDVGILDFIPPTDLSCVQGPESIFVSLKNYGAIAQSLIPVSYSYEFMGGTPSTPINTIFGGVLGGGSLVNFELNQQPDFSLAGKYTLKIWTELEGDEDPSNDTLIHEIETAVLLPFFENFESYSQQAALPLGWYSNVLDPILEPGFSTLHDLESNVIGQFIGSINTNDFEFTTHRIGPLNENSILTFDYRFVTFDNQNQTVPYTLDSNDQLLVSVSTDCGDSFQFLSLIQGPDEIPTLFFKQAQVLLDDFEGEVISIRIQVSNGGSGLFFVDMDNFNIQGCPSSLFIEGDVISPTFQANNGSIFATPSYGMPPFTFEWSNGETTALIEGIAPSSQTVTITDSFGCSESMTFDVVISDTENIESTTFEALSLAPNPTTGTTQLDISLLNSSDIKVNIYDISGRLILVENQKNQQYAQFDLNLEEMSNGLYFVRVQVRDEIRILKLEVIR